MLVHDPSGGSRLVLTSSKVAARRTEGRARRFIPFHVSVRPGATRKGPCHFSRRPLSFLSKHCLKAQIFEVILPTLVNTANADRTPLSIRFAARHRQPDLSFFPKSDSKLESSCRGSLTRLRSKSDVKQCNITRREAD